MTYVLPARLDPAAERSPPSEIAAHELLVHDGLRAARPCRAARRSRGPRRTGCPSRRSSRASPCWSAPGPGVVGPRAAFEREGARRQAVNVERDGRGDRGRLDGRQRREPVDQRRGEMPRDASVTVAAASRTPRAARPRGGSRDRSLRVVHEVRRNIPAATSTTTASATSTRHQRVAQPAAPARVPRRSAAPAAGRPAPAAARARRPKSERRRPARARWRRPGDVSRRASGT